MNLFKSKPLYKRSIKMYHISNDKRSKQSAEAIFMALTQLIKQKDYSSITITDIVSEAKIGRTTFYRCFDSIDDVLQHQCDSSFKNCGEFLEKMIITHNRYDPKDTFIRPFLDYWSTDFFIIELLIEIDRTNIIYNSFHYMVNLLIEKYPNVKSQIEFFDYFIEIRAAIAIAILTQWVRDGRQVAPSELVNIFKEKILLDQFLYDIATNKNKPTQD